MPSTCIFVDVCAPSTHTQEDSGIVDVQATRCVHAEQLCHFNTHPRCTRAHRHAGRPVCPRCVCTCRMPHSASAYSSIGTYKMPCLPSMCTLDASSTLDMHAGHLVWPLHICARRTSRAASAPSLGACRHSTIDMHIVLLLMCTPDLCMRAHTLDA